jgi:hypothetical protein
VALSAKQTRSYANALVDIFGIGNGSGAVAVQATSPSSTPQIKVTSRTFNATGGGTYGQAVPSVSSSGLEQTLYVTGIQANAEYRTNIGFVNRGSAPMGAALTLYDDDGDTLATASISLPPTSFQQNSLATYFPAIAHRTIGAATMRVSMQSGDAVNAFASVVDNRTHDPVYIQGVGAPGGRSLTIPAVGRVQGVNNTFWRSDVTLFNPGGGRQVLALQYGVQRKTVAIGGRETVILADIVAQMGFQNGSGPLHVSWENGSAPVVTSRTYTNSATGTFGQSVDPISAYGSEQFVTGLRSDGSFRSNLGFFNGGASTINVQARLLASNGAVVATNRVTLAGGAQMQISLAALFPGINAAAVGAFTLQANADAPTLFAFGSIVDNITGDPVYLYGR